MKRETHTINVADKVLGRVATEVAVFLRGKHKPDFQPNRDGGDFVVIKNADKMKFTGKKLEKKKYFSHSGYLGGLKETPMKKLFSQTPEEVFKRAVWGMLPTNKLRAEQIKRLKFEK
ncbi:MAG: 50S ribosomal protein L13 [Candidatus Nealsonbacteria bacterium CG09_land_8_20_14_0_10_42_14]|uniref:Large ribosomal subunit protein uL13 n=1 Tax=Candidatus Nealsonbacteria bacterium CG09_land_8_20_14_0_10_42_14 TaxID=1974707 RepID=A0A2H0WXE0_9BACT|nr:MAG: 50S ribosomal protein L13 [Candidatus Nealsonbacteria bacterium CG09_land_8_20_14_0_10_42_14]